MGCCSLHSTSGVRVALALAASAGGSVDLCGVELRGVGLIAPHIAGTAADALVRDTLESGPAIIAQHSTPCQCCCRSDEPTPTSGSVLKCSPDF